MANSEYAEYRCTACKKDIKNVTLQCSICVKCFFHPGCASKHKTYKGNEVIKCKGPFQQIVIENDKMETKKTIGDSRGRLGSSGAMGMVTSMPESSSKQMSIDMKIDWLIKTVMEMKNEVACKNEIKTIIGQIIREEMNEFKQQFDEMKRDIQAKYIEDTGRSYSQTVKDNAKESIIIVKYNNC